VSFDWRALVADGIDVAISFGDQAAPSPVSRKLIDTRILTGLAQTPRPATWSNSFWSGMAKRFRSMHSIRRGSMHRQRSAPSSISCLKLRVRGKTKAAP
jgi:hypothetical protein